MLHNALCYYNHVLDPSLSPVYRLCSYANKTFHHLATECVGTLRERQDLFGDTDILHNIEWDVHDVLECSYLTHNQ